MTTKTPEAAATPPATPEAAATPPDPIGPLIHVQNQGQQNVSLGGRFVGPRTKLILQGAVPDGVCIVDASGAVLARLHPAEVRMLALLHAQGQFWLSDDDYLATARPQVSPSTKSGAAALSW